MEKFIHVEQCDSTQDLIKEQLTGNESQELTISCEHQTHGRGRGVNSWQDSPGTLCFSMSLLPHEKKTFTALEISTIVAEFFYSKGSEIQLKWPNDLISKDGKKCGGILLQNFNSLYIAGIGLNLFQNRDEFGGVYETNFPLEKKSWAQELSQYIRTHRFQSTEALILKWDSYCSHFGKQVRIFEGNEETIGEFVGLGPYGEAILKNAEGTHHLFNGSLRLV
jgi:BirA family biotin operon repressor/biotin-[acetyl-CoA-carboxylase] ligase